MSADSLLEQSDNFDEFEGEGETELNLTREEKRALELRAFRIFRVGRPAPWKRRVHSKYIRQRLEPFVSSLVDLLVKDLREHPPGAT